LFHKLAERIMHLSIKFSYS